MIKTARIDSGGQVKSITGYKELGEVFANEMDADVEGARETVINQWEKVGYQES